MEKLGFGLDDFENVETRRAHLRTKHGYEFLVKLYNAVDRSHFGCSNWEALCKAYGFEEGMQIRFDIRPEDYDDDDISTSGWMWICLQFFLNVSFQTNFLSYVIYIVYLKIFGVHCY